MIFENTKKVKSKSNLSSKVDIIKSHVGVRNSVKLPDKVKIQKRAITTGTARGIKQVCRPNKLTITGFEDCRRIRHICNYIYTICSIKSTFIPQRDLHNIIFYS